MYRNIKENPDKLFDAFNKLTALVIGDVMVDSYTWGKVERISPEAPVPVVSVYKKENRPGGAANVAMNVKAIGARAILCSVIGDDESGSVFIDLLKGQKLSNTGIIRSKNRITTLKTRIIAGNHQMLRVDEEVIHDISATETDALLSRIERLTEEHKVDVIIFQDYEKGLLSPHLIEKITKIANCKNIPVAADPKKKNFTAYRNIALFKPNLKELKNGMNVDFDHTDVKHLTEVVNNLQKKQSIGTVLVTLSEAGVYVSNKNIKQVIPSHRRDIADVSGAGDTVICVAALCLALKFDPVTMAKIANLAGGLVCESVGVVPIDKKRLLKELVNIAGIKLI